MRTVCRFVLKSALVVSSISTVGCAVMSPGLLGNRNCDRCQLKMTSAQLEENRGNLDAAKRIYTEIHQSDPRNAVCLHRLASISVEQKKLDQAEGYYRQAYVLDPNNPLLLADMGYAAFLKKDFEQAEMFFEKSVNLNGHDQVVIANLAIARAWREKDAESLAAFRMIYGEVESIRRLAAIQGARGDHERCQKNLELAGRLNSTLLNASLSGTANTYAANPQPPAGVQPKIELTSLEGNTLSVPTNFVKIPLLVVQPMSNCSTPVRLSEPRPVPRNETIVVSAETKKQSLAPPPESPNTLTVSVASQDESSRQVDSLTFTVEANESTAQTSEVAFDFNGGISENSANTVQSSIAAEPVIAPTVLASATASNELSIIKQASEWRRVGSARPEEISSQLPGNVTSSMAWMATDSSLVSAEQKRQVRPSTIKDICLVSLTEDQKVVPSAPEFSAEFQSQVYSFASKEACEKFRRDPLRYAPVAGGLDVVSVRHAKTVEQGSIDFAVWYRRQLYLFTCAEHADAFQREPRLFVNAE